MAEHMVVKGHSGLVRAAEMVEKLQTKVKKHREQSEAIIGRSLSSAMTVGGGAVVGLLRAKGYAKIAALNSDTDLVVGMALSAVALTGMAGKYSDPLSHIATGMLAVYTARSVESSLLGHK